MLFSFLYYFIGLIAVDCFRHSFIRNDNRFHSKKLILRNNQDTTSTLLKSTTTSAPQPKVPTQAWRWPPMWPFPPDFLDTFQANQTVSTNWLSSSVDDLKNHIYYYLRNDGGEKTILEVGLDNTFRGLTSSYESFNIKDYISGKRVLDSFSESTFDYVILSNGVEYLSSPRELLSDIWKILKPGGMCWICFSSSRAPESSLDPVRMWVTMTDEQKIWIAGSYFHYSAGDGWKDIEGHDLLGSTGKAGMVFEKPGDMTDRPAIFVVQAKKTEFLSPTDSGFSASDYIATSLKALLDLGKDDREFISLRLATEYERTVDEEARTALLNSAARIEQIYSILKNVKEIVIPSPIKAMLATLLVPNWKNTPEQRVALSRGLGLDTSEKEFWPSLGGATAAMAPRNKIAFLADIIPSFGENSRVLAIAEVIMKVTGALKARFPTKTDGELQAVAADLSISEFLNKNPKSSDESDFNRIMKYCEVVSLEDFDAIFKECTVG